MDTCDKESEQMIPKTSIFTLYVFITSFIFFGCASTINFTPEDFCEKPENQQMARIILKRSLSMVGAGVRIEIFDNYQPIGAVGPGGELCWDRYPGELFLRGCYTSQRDAPVLWGHLKLHAKANEVYYIVVEATMAGAVLYKK